MLLVESLDGLALCPDGVYVDATFGRGGHSAAVLARLGPAGRLVAFDRDPAAALRAAAAPFDDPRFRFVGRPFSCMADELPAASVDGVLFDLGVSSPQLDEAGRGFSFQKDGPLDMRMDPRSGRTAAEWLAAAREEDIARVLRDWGEERHARRIARAIVQTRIETPIVRTAQLAALVAATVPGREPGKHPATRAFQALRIAVNDELDELRVALPRAMALLKRGGRLVVISFHSLEDRMVKQFMRRESARDVWPAGLPVPVSQLGEARLRPLGGAQRAGEAELAVNVRARSAVLRVAERLA